METKGTMTTAELLKSFMDGLESLRSDVREDNVNLGVAMGQRFDGVDSSIEQLNEKVRIQNGRVATLEARNLHPREPDRALKVLLALFATPMFWASVIVLILCLTYVGVLTQMALRAMTKWGY